jgi:hypothetical protein
MAGIQYNNNVLDQGFTPVLLADVFANRPIPGLLGRVFISTDTHVFYRDYGTTWVMIGGSGGGGTNYPLFLSDKLEQNLQSDSAFFSFTTPDDGLLHPYRVSAWQNVFWFLPGGSGIARVDVTYIDKSGNTLTQTLCRSATSGYLQEDNGIECLTIVAAPNTSISFSTYGFSIYQTGDIYGCIELLSASAYPIIPIPLESFGVSIFNQSGSNYNALTAILNSVNISGLTAVTITSRGAAFGVASNPLSIGNNLQLTVQVGVINIANLVSVNTGSPITYTIVNNGTNFPTLTFDLTGVDISKGIQIGTN